VGAWGTGIFSDDFACDVRGTYRDLIGDGVAPEEATQRVIAEYGNALDDPDEGAVFWVALAVTQWKLGRLADDVRDEAVRAIDGGGDLARWADDPPQHRQRQRALAKAKEQLLSPQRKPVRVAKRERSTSPFAPGDFFTYVHDSGRVFVFWVVKNHLDGDDASPVVELLDIDPDHIPGAELLAKRPPISSHLPRPGRGGIEPAGFWLLGCQRLPEGRWQIVGHAERPADRPRPGGVATWVNPRKKFLQRDSLDRRLDAYL